MQNPFPPKGGQQWRLLEAMLQGEKIDPINAILKHNVLIPAARCAELRRLGWPVRKIEMLHPDQEHFPDAKLPCYLIDAHFRQWAKDSPPGTHPRQYPGEDGRGRFTEDFFDKEVVE